MQFAYKKFHWITFTIFVFFPFSHFTHAADAPKKIAPQKPGATKPLKKEQIVVDPESLQRMLAAYEKYRWIKEDKKTLEYLRSIPEKFQAASNSINLAPAKEFSERKEKNSCKNTPALDDKLGPVRDQDSIGWCFAYTAADLLSHRFGTRVSAMDISLTHSRLPATIRKNRPSRDGVLRTSDLASGTIEDATLIMRGAGGICREDDLRSDGLNYDLIYPAPDKTTVENIKVSIKEMLDEIEDWSSRRSPRPAELLSFLECSNSDRMRSLLPGLSQNDILAIMEYASAEEILPWIQHLACAGKRIKIPDTMQMERLAVNANTQTGHHLLPAIDAELDNNNIVGISYSPHFFYSEKRIEAEKKILKEQGKDPEKWRELNGAHASAIVGRRFNPLTETCEYKIRNTWGRTCDSYDLNKVSCEEGNVWVSESSLRDNMYHATWIKR